MLREIYKGENQTLNQIKEFVEKKLMIIVILILTI